MRNFKKKVKKNISKVLVSLIITMLFIPKLIMYNEAIAASSHTVTISNSTTRGTEEYTQDNVTLVFQKNCQLTYGYPGTRETVNKSAGDTFECTTQGYYYVDEDLYKLVIDREPPQIIEAGKWYDEVSHYNWYFFYITCSAGTGSVGECARLKELKIYENGRDVSSTNLGSNSDTVGNVNWGYIYIKSYCDESYKLELTDYAGNMVEYTYTSAAEGALGTENNENRSHSYEGTLPAETPGGSSPSTDAADADDDEDDDDDDDDDSTTTTDNILDDDDIIKYVGIGDLFDIKLTHIKDSIIVWRGLGGKAKNGLLHAISFLVTKLADIANTLVSVLVDAGSDIDVGNVFFNYERSEVSIDRDKEPGDSTFFVTKGEYIEQSGIWKESVDPTKIIEIGAHELDGTKYNSDQIELIKDDKGEAQVKLADGAKKITTDIVYEIPNVRVTPLTIFSNKIPMLDANYFKEVDTSDPEMAKKSTTAALKNVVVGWYRIFRLVAVVGLLAVLVFLGIKMILSSVAEKKSKYKEMIMDWVVAMCLVFCLHYIMAFTMTMVAGICDTILGRNGSADVVEVIIIEDNTESDSDKVAVTDDGTFAHGAIGSGGDLVAVDYLTNLTGYMRAQVNYKDGSRSLTGSIMYLMLTLYTIYFAWIYLKRLFTLTFLTFIAPLVALTYPIDKVRDGKAQAFNYWLREYMVNATLPIIHLILYLLFIGTAMELIVDHPLYAIAAMAFLIPAQKIVKEMFGIKATNDPTGKAMAGAAMGSAIANLAKQAGGALKKGDDKKSEDSKGKTRTKETPDTDKDKDKDKNIGTGEGAAGSDEIAANLQGITDGGNSDGGQRPEGEHPEGERPEGEHPEGEPPEGGEHQEGAEEPADEENQDEGTEEQYEESDELREARELEEYEQGRLAVYAEDYGTDSEQYRNAAGDAQAARELREEIEARDRANAQEQPRQTEPPAEEQPQESEPPVEEQPRETEPPEEEQPAEEQPAEEQPAEEPPAEEQPQERGNQQSADGAQEGQESSGKEPKTEIGKAIKAEKEKEAKKKNTPFKKARMIGATYRGGKQGLNNIAKSDRQGLRKAFKKDGMKGVKKALGHNIARRAIKAPKAASRFIRNKFNLPKGAKGVATAVGRMGKFAAKTAIKGAVAATAIGTMGAIGLAAGAVGGDLDAVWKGLAGGAAAGMALSKGIANRTDRIMDKKLPELGKDIQKAHYGDKEYNEREADKAAKADYRRYLEDQKGYTTGEAKDRADVFAKMRRLGMTDVKKMDKAYDRLMEQDGIETKKQAMDRLDYYKEQYGDQLGVSDIDAMNADYNKHGGNKESIAADVQSYKDYHDNAGLTDLGQMGRALDVERSLATSMDPETARATTLGIARDIASPEVYRNKDSNENRIAAETEHFKPQYGEERARKIAERKNQLEQRIVDPYNEHRPGRNNRNAQ